MGERLLYTPHLVKSSLMLNCVTLLNMDTREILIEAMRGRSRLWLARECGVSLACVSMWLSGKRRPSGSAMVILRRLCVDK